MFDNQAPKFFLFNSPVRFLPAVLLLSGACTQVLESPHQEHLLMLRSAPIAGCGDGIVQSPEQCDDGNLDDDDGCDATCKPSGVAMVSTGDATTCAVTLAGNVKCWGRGDQGQLGQASTIDIGDDEIPAAVSFVELGARAQHVTTSGTQAFAVLADGSVRAWGHNAGFELGLTHTHTVGDDETPIDAVPTLVDRAEELAVGDGFSCALLAAGQIECWGRGDEGQLGHGNPSGLGMGTPSAGSVLVELAEPAQQVTVGAAHACALLPDGSVHCWGHNDVGQLGYGHTSNIGDNEPAATGGEVSLGGVVTKIVAGASHTCALLESGVVRCWGYNDVGQLGYGHTSNIGDDEVPTTQAPVALGGEAVDLIAAGQHSCALLNTGALYCWGGNADGRLGYGHGHDIGDDETPASVAPLDFGGAGVVSIFGGALSQHTCALLDTGALRCWGVDDRGQLGLGMSTSEGELAAGPGSVPDIILIEDPDL
ncbi:MAG: DUF4215 domain-containing protein [Myxococcota bacterium]